MTPATVIDWFRDLDAGAAKVEADHYGRWDEEQSAQWIAAGHSALASAFPPGHVILVRWSAAIGLAKEQKTTIPHSTAFPSARGILRAGLQILEADRLGSLMDGIRADTVSEVLDQAEHLLPKYPVAAAVLAGGALETHLLHLCQRSELTWGEGPGSIAKYDAAIAQERNKGTAIYSATDSRLVGGWGSERNEAAHGPTKFRYTKDDVRIMIEGIRQFIARTP